jgi:hypothetical protein
MNERRKYMNDKKIKATLAPCGLCCTTCFAHVDGDIRMYSMKLKEKLGSFHINAQRFEELLDDPIFKNYPYFREMLDYFASVDCNGCRKEQCKLFKNCGVRGCHQEKQIDFCYQCDEFPCDKTNFDPGLQKGWVTTNNKIREVGIEKFWETVKNRSRYS